MNDSRVPALIWHTQRADRAIEEPVLKIGGRPVFYAETEWPTCDECDTEMDFLAQIALQKPLQLSDRFAMAYVFMCPGQYADNGRLECKTYDAMSGCNCVILQKKDSTTFLGSREAVPDFGTYPDYMVSLTQTEEPNIATSAGDVDSSLKGKVSWECKLGGVPAWVQSNDTPACPECGGETVFCAQLKAEFADPLPADSRLPDEPKYRFFEFGDAGLGYVFICEDECSPAGGAFLWQCS